MKRIGKQLFVTVVAISLSWISAYGNGMSGMSDNNVQFLNIMLKNTAVSIALADKPVMTYDSDILSFYKVGGSFQVPVEDVQEWNFSNVPTAIARYERAKPDITYGTAYLANLKPGSKAVIYNAKGEQMRSEIVNAQGEAVLEFGSLPKGVYIIKTSCNTIKITNK